MKTKISVLLTLALVLSVFAGCQSASQPPVSTPPNTEPVTTTALPDATTSASPLQETTAPAETAPSQPAESVAPSQPAKETQPPENAAVSAKISRAEAIRIALENAGFQESEVTRIEAELDFDNGQTKYEVSFHKDQYEYDYDIHAETGKVLGFGRELDD